MSVAFQPAGMQDGDYVAHARAADPVDLDARTGQRVEHTDVGEPPRASALENEPNGATGDAASETGQSGVNRVAS